MNSNSINVIFIVAVVVLTNPVENVTDTPSIEAQQNAVSFSLTGMTIDEVCCLPDKVIIQSIP